MKRLLDVAVVLSAVCAVIVTGLVIRRELFPPLPPGHPGPPRKVADWRAFATAGTRIGPRDARIEIVEFSDFQCPFCRSLTGSLKALRAKYPQDIAIVYRHYPLDGIHPHARTAALASECAGAQGRFEAYHDLLYAKQDSIGEIPWERLADAAGIPDRGAFQSCLAQRTFAPRVESDARAASELGVSVTPSLLIDGMLYQGAPGDADLERMVAGALARR